MGWLQNEPKTTFKNLMETFFWVNEREEIFGKTYKDEINNEVSDKGKILWYFQHLLLGIYFGFSRLTQLVLRKLKIFLLAFLIFLLFLFIIFDLIVIELAKSKIFFLIIFEGENLPVFMIGFIYSYHVMM